MMSHAQSPLPLQFDTETSIKLIKLYESHRALWDSKCYEYRNNNIREDAWKSISLEMGYPVDDLRKKIKILLATNRKERGKRRKSLLTGSATADVYKSKWFAYEYFNFINDRETLTNVLEISSDTIEQYSLLELQQENENTEPSNDVETPSFSASNASYKKRKRLAPPNNKLYMLDEAMELLKECVQGQDDSYTSFGAHIANELRKYDAKTLAHVKEGINNIIFQADMDQIPQSPVQPEIQSENLETLIEEIQDVDEEESSLRPPQQQSPPQQQLPHKRISPIENEEAKRIRLLDMACQRLQNPSSDSQIFAKAWGVEFAKMRPDQQLHAKKFIDDIIYEGRLGNLHRNSIIFNHIPLPLSQPSPDYH